MMLEVNLKVYDTNTSGLKQHEVIIIMDVSHDHKRRPEKTPKQMKKTASSNKPIKVRYISNTMRVKTCASKFRELVQELTGQDAVDLELEAEFSPSARGIRRQLFSAAAGESCATCS